jgi:carbon storage regulator
MDFFSGGIIMLVLTRQVGEEIVIDGDINVLVAGVEGGKVRLGISAPPEVTVDRMEVHDRRAGFDALSNHESRTLGDECDELEPTSWPPIDLGGSD